MERRDPVAHVTMPVVIEDGLWRREILRERSGWRRILAVSLLLLPCAALAGDVYYPEYKRDPVPPVAVVEELAIEDDGAEPACNPANDDCDDPYPESHPSGVAIAE